MSLNNGGGNSCPGVTCAVAIVAGDVEENICWFWWWCVWWCWWCWSSGRMYVVAVEGVGVTARPDRSKNLLSSSRRSKSAWSSVKKKHKIC